VILRVVQAVVMRVPQGGDDGRVAPVGGQAEIAAAQIGRHGGGSAELVGDLLRAAEVAAGDRQRQVRVPAAKQCGRVGARLAGPAQHQYCVHNGSP
jgi:hypothetical protein